MVSLLTLQGAAAQAETPVKRGDVLRVEVLAAPELSRDAPVDVDGRITLPLLGSIEVADRQTEVIRRELMTAFKERGLLTRPEVLVEVASYRKVYVGGSVGRPGAIDFVPGLTARQAVITAGGLRLAPADVTVSKEDILSAIAQRRALAFRMAQTVAQVARLRAELSGAKKLVAPEEELEGIAPTETGDILEAEAAYLDDLRTRIAARKQHGDELIDLISLELRTLEQQAALQTAEADAQKAEIENARSLVERGLMPRPRLTEMQRVQSQLSRDRLDNAAFSARAQQAAETVRFEMLEETLRTREETRRKLSEALAERSDIAAEIAAIDMRIFAAGGATGNTVTPQLVIFRQTKGQPVQIDTANLDDPVEPGDVLDLRLEIPSGIPLTPPETPAVGTGDSALPTDALFGSDDRP